MKKFDIRDHIWEIFNIARTNKTDLRSAYNLFMTNVVIGCNRYIGKCYRDHDYELLKKKYSLLSKDAIQYQKELFINLINRFDLPLRAEWKANNQKDFNWICRIDVGAIGMKPFEEPKDKKETPDQKKKRNYDFNKKYSKKNKRNSNEIDPNDDSWIQTIYDLF